MNPFNHATKHSSWLGASYEIGADGRCPRCRENAESCVCDDMGCPICRGIECVCQTASETVYPAYQTMTAAERVLDASQADASEIATEGI